MVEASSLTHAAIQTEEGAEVLFKPFPGFQTEAAAAGDFELLLGGAKGPGKTALLVALALRQIAKSAYKAVLARTTYQEVQDLIDRSHQLYPKLPEKPGWNGSLRRWTFPSGATVNFSYMETAEDAEQWQGKEPCLFGWDEFGKAKDPRAYELMLAELRCKDPTVHCQAILTANPGQRNHQYIKRRWVVPCGENGGSVWYRYSLPNGMTDLKSRRWIPGRVWDNPIYANDPKYLSTVCSLNERDRKYLLGGSWDSPEGMAFGELDEKIHFCRPFPVPSHWPMWAGHDWGFAHPWVFCWIASDEDGNLWVVDTIWGRRDKDTQIAQRIKSKAPLEQIATIYAGSDVFSKHRARVEEADAPQTSERYLAEGMMVVPAKTEREQGARTLREVLAWKEIGPDGEDGEPQLRFMDTSGNRRLFAQLESLTTDPDDPEDVLKVDADEKGAGGDDGYDCLRYAVHSRPRKARQTWLTDRRWRINDPDVLRRESLLKRTGQMTTTKARVSKFDAYT